jgi:hypothetical protein
MTRVSRCSLAALLVLVALCVLWIFGHDALAKKPVPAPTAKPTPAEPAAAVPDKKAKTYSFGGLDIDGRLRTPQLLYFLNRMKSEFDATAPTHRSFIPELKASPNEM